MRFKSNKKNMAVPKIAKLEDVLSKYLDGDGKILDTKITRLTAPGDNFGSEMLKVDICVKNKQGTKEDLSVVAKLIPESEFARAIFNIQVSFKIEAEFYATIIPTLQDFQRKEGVDDVVDFFPNFFGARYNLNGGTDVDDNAVLILENLKLEGYENVSRNIGFDLPTAKLILGSLARFHAVPIALKQKDPETFETKIKAFMSCMYPSAPRPPIEIIMKYIYEIMRESDTCRHLVPKMERSAKKHAVLCNDFREPFTTLSHKDFWVNNIMIKFDNQSPVACKFLDFQVYSYDSPAADLFFFLFSSIQIDVLKNNLDTLLEYYHQQFQKTLRSLNCDLHFSYEKLLEELSLTSEWELAHTVFMYMMVINGPKGGIPLPKDLKSIDSKPPEIQIPETTKERIRWICEECERRNWLNF